MKIWLLIILLVSCVAGFAFSYGYAYKKVSGALVSSETHASAASTFLINK